MDYLAFTKMTKPASPSFTCGVSSIDKMVNDSYFLCLLKRSYAYEVTFENKVVAYYRIELRRFDNSSFDPPLEEYSLDKYNDLYALHLQYIAVREDCQGHGIGKAVLSHILRTIETITRYCPLRLVTLDAFQELIPWYQKHGFEVLAQNLDDPETTLMFLDLISLEDFDKIKALNDAYM